MTSPWALALTTVTWRVGRSTNVAETDTVAAAIGRAQVGLEPQPSAAPPQPENPEPGAGVAVIAAGALAVGAGELTWLAFVTVYWRVAVAASPTSPKSSIAGETTS